MNIPEELAALSQWVLWRYENKTKLPYSAIRPGLASSTDAETWSYLVPAQTKFELSLSNGNPFSGIGFVFTTDDPYVGIDLDGCIGPDGVVTEWAQQVIAECPTYAEISPSGTGIKLFGRGKVPSTKGKKRAVDAPKVCDKSPAIELYDWGRYFAVTGNALPGSPMVCNDIQDGLDAIWIRHGFVQQMDLAPPPKPAAPALPSSQTGDDNRLDRCLRYVAKMDPSIEGSGGDDALFAVGCECARFDLSDRDSMTVMLDFNRRCKPEWGEHRLRYKITQGRKRVEEDGELGMRLREDRPQDSRPQVDLSQFMEQVGSYRREHSGERIDIPLAPPRNDATARESVNEPSKNTGNKALTLTNLVWRKFPTEVLPGVVQEFVQASSTSIDCDESMVALPVICTLAGAIGCTRYAMLKTGWAEPSVVWGAVNSESGSKKSPAIDAPLKAIIKQEMANIKAHEQEVLKYQLAMASHKVDLQQWHKNRKANNDPAPEEPARPVCRRSLVNDSTIEALAERLRDNPRGLTLKIDELSGHFGGMNQYRAKGKGGDEAKWLSMHGARELLVDRKGGDKPTLAIRRAAVSIIGGIQPAILKRSLGRAEFESGMAARFLIVSPPAKVSKWTDEIVPNELEESFASSVFKLQYLDFRSKEDELVPGFIPLSLEAKELFRQFHDEHAEEAAGLTGDLGAAFSKLTGYAARLALILEYAKWAQSNAFDEPGCISLESMQAGISLAHWFSHETRRTYSQFRETDDQAETRKVLDLINRMGGSITARELTANSRRFRSSVDEAEKFLQQLVDAGLGNWHVVTTSGPSSRRFQISSVVSVSAAKQGDF